MTVDTLYEIGMLFKCNADLEELRNLNEDLSEFEKEKTYVIYYITINVESDDIQLVYWFGTLDNRFRDYNIDEKTLKNLLDCGLFEKIEDEKTITVNVNYKNISENTEVNEMILVLENTDLNNKDYIGKLICDSYHSEYFDGCRVSVRDEFEINSVNVKS